MRLRRNSLFILFCCFWFAAIAQAATLTVQLKDPSGAAVASALVAVGQEAKQPVNLPGDGKGNYRISTMSAGNYQLSIVADGFKPIQKSIAVVEPETTLPISLELAEVETAVDVDTDLSKLANSDPAYVALRKGPLTETWEVSNFKFFRENAEITLTGKVSFAAPVLGKTVTAIFEGEGMFGLTPVTL